MTPKARTTIIGAAALLLLLAFTLGAGSNEAKGQDYDFDRFQLYTACEPVRLVVERLYEDAAEIGLTKRDIELTTRSRLRAARIYNPEESGPTSLYININTLGPAYNTDVFFDQIAQTTHGGFGVATTWMTGGTGTHGGNSGFILQRLSRHIDRFIDAYLEVNGADCD